MKTDKDIFDKIMSSQVFKIFEPYYKKNKEILLYLFFGGLAFIISVTSYGICNVYLNINELVANGVSWILAVLFAFVTNRTWVFKVKISGVNNLIKQMISFFGGRVATLIVEEIILLVFVTWLQYNSMAIKIIAQIIVIILNYIISKFWVFK